MSALVAWKRGLKTPDLTVSCLAELTEDPTPTARGIECTKLAV
eukprot:CAMPEP_0115260126 /NCGR_PEP_ID=MMETSP0270-20121206/48179_1 /TAXON_ID=71861 /ORGANISM="Scrippsiella trochoidea, Strain CCMP3099" /LENGTH=42 /DNA_ID= /DNA_START= /DNA_END= /DNA_ORIENTATION=